MKLGFGMSRCPAKASPVELLLHCIAPVHVFSKYAGAVLQYCCAALEGEEPVTCDILRLGAHPMGGLLPEPCSGCYHTVPQKCPNVCKMGDNVGRENRESSV